MELPLEAVPNFSEGRDRETIDALGGRAFGATRDLLDVHADADHNRSVFTLVGDDAALVEALVAAVACARERIDLRDHEGAHPRIGAADVVPLVPIRSDQMAARAGGGAAARRSGSGTSSALPVFLYGELGAGRGPAFFRRGGAGRAAAAARRAASSRPTSGRRGSTRAPARCSSARGGR